ncbi:MAG: transporter [Bdellovibrio sp.]|nr:transporter [Methylotenera sp.]
MKYGVNVMRKNKCFIFYVAVFLTQFSVFGYAEPDHEEYAVTPYRPSVSSPAQLPSAGYLELEIGGLSTKTDSAKRHSTPYDFKLAFNEQWGAVITGEAIIQTDDGQGSRAYSFGDTLIVLKRAFVLDHESTFGVEAGIKIPTAKTSIGTGKEDYSFNSIFSHDFGAIHLDANFNLTHVGFVNDGESSIQTGEAASFAYSLNNKISLIAELSGVQRSGTDSTAQLLTAFTYSPSKVLTIDIGVASGLNRASQDYSIFFGAVLPVAELW